MTDETTDAIDLDPTNDYTLVTDRRTDYVYEMVGIAHMVLGGDEMSRIIPGLPIGKPIREMISDGAIRRRPDDVPPLTGRAQIWRFDPPVTLRSKDLVIADATGQPTVMRDGVAIARGVQVPSPSAKLVMQIPPP